MKTARRNIVGKYALLTTAASLAIGGSVADAGFMHAKTAGGGYTLTAVDTGAGTGKLAGDEIYQIYILDNGTGPTAGTNSLAGMDAIVTGLDALGQPGASDLVVRTADNGDGTSTADFDGDAVISGHASYIRAGTTRQWYTAYMFPNATGPSAQYPDPTEVASFNVAGLTNTSGTPAGVIADSGANGGKGALMGQVAVPFGDYWQLTGQFAAGGSTNIDSNQTDPLTNYQPEPASFTPLGLGLGALAIHRRRV